MGENEKLGFTFEVNPYDFSTFNRFFGATTPWVENGTSATIPWNGNVCGRISVADHTLNLGNARLKSEQEYIAEKHKQSADKLMREIYESSQKPMELLSKETAKAFEESCNGYLETLSEVSKSLNPCLEHLIAHFGKTSKRKAHKHYKPKFTL